MASASSSARRKLSTNSGVSTGTSALARLMGPPLPKSAPRARWARMIWSSSTSSVGMKRSAMVTMRASSSVGTRSRRSGRPSHASPSVSARGAVVSVSTDPMSTRTTSRRLRKAANSSPAQEKSKTQKLKNGSPGANSTWARNVSAISQRSGRNARQNQAAGTPLSR